jgi:hypothetical protein
MRRPRLLAAATVVTALAVGSLALSMAPAAGAVAGSMEGEKFTAPYGATVRTDAAASAGRYLLVDSNVAATATVTSARPATTLMLTQHGEGDTKVAVSVDGRQVTTLTLRSESFHSYTVGGSWAAGSHRVEVRLMNAATQNLYLDAVAFHSPAGSTPGSAPAPSPAPKPAPRPTTPPTTPPTTAPAPKPSAPAVGERVITAAYTTGYTWFDNTPAGSAEISHPVLHARAGGTGTYNDPITIAVGHSLATGRDVLDYPAGTRLYLPHVRRYFIVEDTCGDGGAPQNRGCHDLSTAASGASTWVDLYVGGGSGDSETAVQDCASKVTDGDSELHRLIVKPASTYAVVPGPLFQKGRCTALYPAAAVVAP